MTMKKFLKVETKAKDLKNFSKALDDLKHVFVYVGIPQGEKRSDGISNADLAFIHENGSSDGVIPARPFLKPTVEEQQSTIKKAFEKSATCALHQQDQQSRAVLDALAIKLQTEVRKTITTSKGFAPLKAKSIESKKTVMSARSEKERVKRIAQAKPLIDTGSMLGSITAFVVKE